MFRKAVAVLLLALLTGACARQQAAFLSVPAGARLSIDGEPIGVTPCSFSYKESAGESYEVRLEMEGYEPVRRTVTADKWDSAARKKWLAAGVVWSPLWLGALFTKKLDDRYEFVLRPAVPPLLARSASPPPQPQL
jgi:hypothetical protein